jgi:tetratricopeptide (TPR) repeat protein
MNEIILSGLLREALERRDLSAGYALLSEHHTHLTPEALLRNGNILLYEISRWMAMWPDARRLVQAALETSSLGDRGTATLASFAHFRLAEAFFALVTRENGVAGKSAEQVLSLAGSIDPHLVASAHFCKGRALAITGQQQEALGHMGESSRMFSELNLQCLAAVANLQAHRLYLHTNKYPDAEAILKTAETCLRDTGDILNKAYIQYLWGRTFRFRGKYADAAECFRHAAQQYSDEAVLRGGTPHRIILRALHGEARTQRLSAASPKLAPGMRSELRNKVSMILSDARAMAEKLDARPHDKAKIWLGEAYLAFDNGDHDGALTQSEAILKAYSSSPKDASILSRVHLLRFKIHIAFLEQRSNREYHRKAAATEVALALEFGKQQTSHRILARAYIAQGHFALVSTPCGGGVEEARVHAATAEGLLHSEDQDYLRVELKALKAQLVDGAPPLALSFPHSELYRKNLKKIVDQRIKPEIIRGTYHLYHSPADMKKKTGIATRTINEALKSLPERKWRKKVTH